MTPGLSFFHDRRGASSVQMLVLACIVALGGAAGIRLLGAAVGARAKCAGDEIETMAGGGVPCKDTGADPAGANQAPQPQPAPENQPAVSDDEQPGEPSQAEPEPAAEPGGQDGRESDGEQPEESDARGEFLAIVADILGITDAKKCITEGDIMACVMTALNFTPWKLLGTGFKLIANANRIRKAVDKYMAFLAARRAKKAADEARRAEEAARKGCKGGSCGGPVCFAPGTPVHTENGLVPIEELQVGDRVWSRDERTGTEGYRPVAHTFVTPDQPLVALALEDPSGAIETLEATPQHPFRVAGRGWVAAGDLRSGDELVGSGSARLRVADSRASSRRSTVYNFEVEDFHTYFVGDAGAWVHNSCASEAAKNLRKMGLEGVDLAGRSFNSGRKALEKAGFKLAETTPTGRRVFRNPKTRSEVYYDSGGALAPGQKPHWHVRDAAGNRSDRSGRIVGSDEAAGHIPGA